MIAAQTYKGQSPKVRKTESPEACERGFELGVSAWTHAHFQPESPEVRKRVGVRVSIQSVTE